MQQDIETAIGAGIYDQGYKADNGSGNNSRCYIFYTESGFFSGGEDRVSPTVQIPEIVLKSQERTHEQSYVNQYFHRKIVWRNICRCRVFSGESALDGENVLISIYPLNLSLMYSDIWVSSYGTFAR